MAIEIGDKFECDGVAGQIVGLELDADDELAVLIVELDDGSGYAAVSVRAIESIESRPMVLH